EDGIRDDLVTGVQTCALPILGTTWQIRLPFLSIIPSTGILSFQFLPWHLGAFLFQWRFLFLPPIKVSSISTKFFSMVPKTGQSKIGRASCRETGYINVD